jgi:hypothetical protein
MVSSDDELAELLKVGTTIKESSSDNCAFLSWRSNCLQFLERQFGKTDTLYIDFQGIAFEMPPELSRRVAGASRRAIHTKGNVTKLMQFDDEAARRQFFRRAIDCACEILSAAQISLRNSLRRD